MHYIKQNGQTIELDGTEEYFTLCNGCGEELALTIDELVEMAYKHGFYDIEWYCNPCAESKKIVSEALSILNQKRQ